MLRFHSIRLSSLFLSTTSFFPLTAISIPPFRFRSQMASYSSSSSSSSSSKLLFRSTYTYLLADASHPEKPAVLIDPVDKTVDRDLSLIQELGLKLVYALNTHVHADHVTGTGLIKSKVPDVKSVISKASGATADLYVEPSDKICFGDVFLEEMHLANLNLEWHSQENPNNTWMWKDRFSGWEFRAALQINPFTDFYVPKDTLIYAAHDYKGFTVSTVGEEMQYNPRLTKDEETFKNIMSNLNLSYPKMIDIAVPANMACGIQSKTS